MGDCESGAAEMGGRAVGTGLAAAGSWEDAARLLGVAVAVLGMSVLAGWVFDVGLFKSVLPGLTAMQPQTALSLVLAGVALAAQAGAGVGMVWPAAGCDAAVLLVAGQALAQYATGWELGTDRLLFPHAVLQQLVDHPFPGRMSPATSVCLILVALGHLLAQAGRDRPRAWSEALLTCGLLLASLALVGYLHDVEALHSFGLFAPVALHTGLALAALCVGGLAAQPQGSWIRRLGSDSAGASLLQRLAPAAILAPVLFGLLARWGIDRGYYAPNFALSLYTVGTMAVLLLLLFAEAARLDDAEARRRRAAADRERALRESELSRARLEAVVRHLPAGVIIAEAPSGRLVLGNDRVQEILRHPFVPADSLDGYAAYRGFHADGRTYAPHEWPLARAIARGEEVADEEIEIERGDGTRGILSVSAAPIRDGDRVVAGVVVLTDITERREMERRSERLALEDALTGLPNRKLFADRLDTALAQAAREGDHVAVLLLDLDDFKDVNDTTLTK